jgi:hypothetical protein
MKRLLGVVWIACCALLLGSGLLRLSASPPAGDLSLPALADPRTPPGKYHSATAVVPQASPCVARGCHDPGVPHRAGKGAGFLNGHLRTLDCTACHAVAPPGTEVLPASAGTGRGYGGLFAIDASHRLPAGWDFLPRNGEGCRTCHAPGGSFPWGRLGYAAPEGAALSDLAQANIIDQGVPWVIPVF